MNRLDELRDSLAWVKFELYDMDAQGDYRVELEDRLTVLAAKLAFVEEQIGPPTWVDDVEAWAEEVRDQILSRSVIVAKKNPAWDNEAMKNTRKKLEPTAPIGISLDEARDMALAKGIVVMPWRDNRYQVNIRGRDKVLLRDATAKTVKAFVTSYNPIPGSSAEAQAEAVMASEDQPHGR